MSTQTAPISDAAALLIENAAASVPTIQIHPSEVYVDPSRNGRHEGSNNKKTVRALADDIAINGQLQPIGVAPWTPPTKHADGTELTEEEADEYASKTCRLVYGYQRHAAVSLLMEEGKATHIVAVVGDWDDRGALNANISENLKRRDLNMMDKSRAVNLLLAQPHTNGKDVAKAMGISPAMVTKFKAMANLTPKLQQLVIDQKLTVDGAYDLAGKSFEEQDAAADTIIAELAEDVVGGSATGAAKKRKGKKASKAADSEVVKKAPTLKQVRQTFEYVAAGCKDEEGTVKMEMPDGAVALSKDLVKFTQGKVSESLMLKRLAAAFA